MNKQITVYDNAVSARTYISYIAEQAGGLACIGRDGKLYIKTIGESTVELPIRYFENYTWGDKFSISRVKYEDGVQLFEKGDTSNNTAYINQDNMYIVDQDQIDNIYNQLNGLEVYSFEGDSIIDPALDIGDIIIIDGKSIIYQGDMKYVGKFKASIASKIQSKAKEETTIRTPSQKTINRRVLSRIDQAEGQIEQVIQEQEGVNNKMTQQTQDINSITSTVSETKKVVEQLGENTVKTDEYNTYVQTVQSTIEQLNNQIEFRFVNAIDRAEAIEEVVNENQSVLEEYIRFSGALIELGRVGNDFTAELSNTQLAFKQNGTAIAYISNNKLYITDAEIKNKLTIGKFAFIPRSNGNLSFKWIGG